MNIEHKPGETKGHFIAFESGKKAGEVAYTHAGPGKFIIEHTEVDPAFKGSGVGSSLVTAAVEYARANNLKVMPLCPYANSLFQRKPEWADIRF